MGKNSVFPFLFFLGVLAWGGCERRSTDFDSGPAGPVDTLPPPVSAVGDSFFLEEYKGLEFVYRVIDELFRERGLVTPDSGKVDYPGLHASFLFRTLVDSLKTFDLSHLSSRQDSFALMINTYNVMVIEGLRVLGFPRADHQNFSLFKTPFPMLGDTLTLDQLEKKSPHYIKRFNDPRSHFVLNCAALSCPPLKNTAFKGSRLYADLDELTRFFINNNGFNPILENTPPKVSPLFDWYTTDFRGWVQSEATGTLLDSATGADRIHFMHSYLQNGEKRNKIAGGVIGFLDYNWGLNSQ